MKTTITIDDEDRAECPASPWTAAMKDENDDLLSSAGVGVTRQAALLDLLDNVDREFPGFRMDAGV